MIELKTPATAPQAVIEMLEIPACVCPSFLPCEYNLLVLSFSAALFVLPKPPSADSFPTDCSTHFRRVFVSC